MDKETLSHYGWIVILVLILAVMLALASPFGTFIAGAIKSTTAGLFSVNQAALGSAGIDVNDMVFENCDHVETEIRNATDTYTGDTCCKNCGKVMATGQTVRPKIPEGGTYYVGVTSTSTNSLYSYTAKYGPGEEFPETITNGDVYVYGDYEYRYNQQYVSSNNWETVETINGWGVRVISTGKVSYKNILNSINNAPITSLKNTFKGCLYIKESPIIPNTVTIMERTFYGCYALESVPNIPYGVYNIKSAFDSCNKLIDLRNVILPETITDMSGTFYDCINLQYAPAIPKNVTNMASTFNGCTSLLESPNLSELYNLQNMTWTFIDCTSLKNVSVIPQNVTTILGTFLGCTSLSGTIELNCTAVSEVSKWQNCFSGVDFETQNLTLTGESPYIDNYGASGSNYCAECNGKCQNNH